LSNQLYEGLKKRAYDASIREIVAMDRILQLNLDFMNDFELTVAWRRMHSQSILRQVTPPLYETVELP
jgi:hypothetical protein